MKTYTCPPMLFARTNTAPNTTVESLNEYSYRFTASMARLTRSPELRPPRRSLRSIGIPNRYDTLATQIRWARVRFYILHRRQRFSPPPSVHVHSDELDESETSSILQHEILADQSTFNRVDADLLCVGGQFS
ncbi:hypothetical protein OPT61_g4082 [Boeremia exigua]|uniref:Uncharacterized protein n=1 Tax=Boeremia exigua TaxID=749465 RepID=A0ACC2IFN0_9PLEO|nr:hypothetical protein OPT61_g4082 [Boeremia exigua]